MILIIHAFTPIDCTGMACMLFPLCWQTNFIMYAFIFLLTVAGLAQSVERLTAEWEVAGSIPAAGPILRVLKITEK